MGHVLELTEVQWATYEALKRQREAARALLFQSIVGQVESFSVQADNPLLLGLEQADREVYRFELEHGIEYLDAPPPTQVVPRFALFWRLRDALLDSLGGLKVAVSEAQAVHWHTVEKVDGETQWDHVPPQLRIKVAACCEVGVSDLNAYALPPEDEAPLRSRMHGLTEVLWYLYTPHHHAAHPRMPADHAAQVQKWACPERRAAVSARYIKAGAALHAVAQREAQAREAARLQLFHWAQAVRNPVREALELAYGAHANTDGTPHLRLVRQVERVTSAVADWLNYVSTTLHPCAQPVRTGVSILPDDTAESA